MQNLVEVIAILAALMTALIVAGGCKVTPGGRDAAGGWTFSVVDAQIYDGRNPAAEISDLTGKVRLAIVTLNGEDTTPITVAGTVTGGKLSFALPAAPDPAELGDVFAELEDDGAAVIPSGRKVLLAAGLNVYRDTGNQLLGSLTYRKNLNSVIFLYSEGPLSVAFSRAAFTGSWNFEAVGGWNCLMEDETGLTIGSPPADAKWLFYPVNNF